MPVASSILRLMLQALGESDNVWGDPNLNNVIKGLEESSSGLTTVPVGASDVTLDATNYTPSIATHYRYRLHKLTAGTGVGARNIIVPGVAKVYLFANSTGFDQTVKASGGAGVVVRNGTIRMVYCDGLDCYVDDLTLDQIKQAAGTVNLGAQKIQSSAAPTTGNDLTNKTYVDTVATVGAPAATGAQVAAGTATGVYNSPKALADAGAWQASSGSGSWAPDLSTGVTFKRTATGNSTLAAPTNAIAGRTYSFQLVQDATGSRTWSFNSCWDFGASGTPTASTGANKIDLVTAICLDAATPLFRCSFSKAA